MALFAISDLHLSLNGQKPMDKFGTLWENYVDKLYNNWVGVVGKDDYVILAGDTSWAMRLDECFEDFNFLDKLPGIKLILKGNHDYWWTSVTKLNRYVTQNNFKNFFFVHNNVALYNDVAICGTRGWTVPDDLGADSQDARIYCRELGRLSMSLAQAGNKNEIVAVFHFPPTDRDGNVQPDILKILKEYNVKTCVYGHLHSFRKVLEGERDGITFYLVSCDFLNFCPIKISIGGF